MQIPELIWIIRSHFWVSENIYEALKISQPHQKLHGEIFCHTVLFSGLQIPKSVANSRVFSLKLFLCNSHSFINPSIWKYSSVLHMFWSSFGTIHRINNLWLGVKTSPSSQSRGFASILSSSRKEEWMWCKHATTLKSNRYHQEWATP